MKLEENIARIKVIMEANNAKPVHEVSNELYDRILNQHINDRLIMSIDSNLNFKSISIDEQEIGSKPRGLWYGIGPSWINWVRSQMPEWELNNVFKIDIDIDKILKISNSDELLAFNKEYGTTSQFYNVIDWSRVASEYGGIEISPYNHKLRMSREVFWYYGWDVASGCIWDDGVINDIIKL